MPKERKNKREAFYIDTNIALNYITGRNKETIYVIDKLKEMKSIIISSSFLVMEAADFKKDSTYIIHKAMDEKWEIRRIIRDSYQKDLITGDFYNISFWIEELKSKLKIKLYDFLIDTDTWELAQYVSQNSNLSAPDSIHLSSAIIVAQSGIEIQKDVTVPCQIFITNDKFLKGEAEKIKKELELSYPDILTISELNKKILQKR